MSIDVHAVVRQLVGPFTPVGEAHADEVRLINLKDTVKVIEALLLDINEVAEYKDSPEGSRHRIGEYASQFQALLGRSYGQMGNMQRANDVIEELAGLFGDATDMSEMDAADFKDNAGTIWDLRQRAKEIVDEE